VTLYSTTIFGFAGFHESILATASVGTVNLLTTVLAAYLVDIYGRKTLLLHGLILMVGALLLLSLVLTLCNSDETAQGAVAVIATLIFVFGFAIGIGAVLWVIMSEIVPTRIRTKAVGLFLSINYGFNLGIG
jgi:MFS family permease